MSYSVLCFDYNKNYRIDNQQILVGMNLIKKDGMDGEIENLVGKIGKET